MGCSRSYVNFSVSYSHAKNIFTQTFIYYSLTRKTSPPSLLFKEEEYTKMKAPLRRGVGEMLAVVILKIEERPIWGDVGSYLLTQTQKHLLQTFIYYSLKRKNISSRRPLQRGGTHKDESPSLNLLPTSEVSMRGRHLYGDVGN